MELLTYAVELAKGVFGGWAERSIVERGAVIVAGLALAVLAFNLIERLWGFLVTLLLRLVMRRGGFAVSSIQPFPFRLKNVDRKSVV